MGGRQRRNSHTVRGAIRGRKIVACKSISRRKITVKRITTMSETDSEFERGVEKREVMSGWIGVAKHGDGTATQTWAATASQAERQAEALLDNE
jgi:hypothetical protein